MERRGKVWDVWESVRKSSGYAWGSAVEKRGEGEGVGKSGEGVRKNGEGVRKSGEGVGKEWGRLGKTGEE